MTLSGQGHHAVGPFNKRLSCGGARFQSTVMAMMKMSFGKAIVPCPGVNEVISDGPSAENGLVVILAFPQHYSTIWQCLASLLVLFLLGSDIKGFRVCARRLNELAQADWSGKPLAD